MLFLRQLVAGENLFLSDKKVVTEDQGYRLLVLAIGAFMNPFSAKGVIAIRARVSVWDVTVVTVLRHLFS